MISLLFHTIMLTSSATIPTISLGIIGFFICPPPTDYVQIGFCCKWNYSLYSKCCYPSLLLHNITRNMIRVSASKANNNRLTLIKQIMSNRSLALFWLHHEPQGHFWPHYIFKDVQLGNNCSLIPFNRASILMPTYPLYIDWAPSPLCLGTYLLWQEPALLNV